MGSPQYGNEPFGSINEREISLPAKCLASSLRTVFHGIS